MKNITILQKEVPEGFLDTFNRYQETNKIYYIDEENTLQTKDEYYIDEWDCDKKKKIIEILRYYLSLGGSVVEIREDNILLGFAAINGKFMGSEKQYLNLGYIHVSKNYRGKGIGKELFEIICQEARNKGAKKLYIGANPAFDTVNFYESIGCEIAPEIVREIYDHEPLDLQLEYSLLP